jgi:hypothetical protein
MISPVDPLPPVQHEQQTLTITLRQENDMTKKYSKYERMVATEIQKVKLVCLGYYKQFPDDQFCSLRKLADLHEEELSTSTNAPSGMIKMYLITRMQSDCTHLSGTFMLHVLSCYLE